MAAAADIENIDKRLRRMEIFHMVGLAIIILGSISAIVYKLKKTTA